MHPPPRILTVSNLATLLGSMPYLARSVAEILKPAGTGVDGPCHNLGTTGSMRGLDFLRSVIMVLGTRSMNEGGGISDSGVRLRCSMKPRRSARRSVHG